MIRIEPTQLQKDKVHAVLKVHESCGRGDFDGDYFKQFFGLLAQLVVCDFLGVECKLDTKGFDGGYDLEWNNKRFDVKCELRLVLLYWKLVLIGTQCSTLRI